MVDCLLERPVVSEKANPLAAALSELRKRAGLSRRQLEQVSDVSEETIKAIEYGRNARPSPDTLRKLATGLATNRALARLDQAASDEMLTTLLRAAHYMPARREPDAADLEATLPPEILARARELVGTDDGQLIPLLDELARRPPESRPGLLRFLAQALELTRTTPPDRG